MKKLMLSLVSVSLMQMSFGKTTESYIQDGLIVHFDAIENAGRLTFDPSATTWKNLVGDNDATLFNASAGCWTGRELTMDGSLYATFDGDFGSEFTVEIVLDSTKSDKTAQYETCFSSSDDVYAVRRWGKTANYLYFIQPNVAKYALWLYNDKGIDLVFESSKVTIVHQAEAPRGDAVKATEGPVATGLRTWQIGSPTAANVLNGRVYAVRVYNRALTQAEREMNAAVDNLRFQRGDCLQKNYVNVMNACANVPAEAEIVATPAFGAHALTAGQAMTFSMNKSSYTAGSETGILKGWTLTTLRNGETIVTSGETATCTFTPQAGDAVKLVWEWDRSDTYHFVPGTRNWNLTTSWTEGVVPPNDVEVTEAVYPSAGGYYSQGNALALKGLTVTQPPSSVHNQPLGFQHELTLGKSGITLRDDIGRAYVYAQRKLTAACDQTWFLDSANLQNVQGVTLYNTFVLPEDVTLTVGGRRATLQCTGGDGALCRGHIRTNGGIWFSSQSYLGAFGTADIFWTNCELDGMPVKTNATGQADMMFQCAIDKDLDAEFKNDVTFAFTNQSAAQMWWYFDRKSTWPMPNDFSINFTGTWKGEISDDLIKMTWKRVSDSTTLLADPFNVGRIVFDTDGSQLSTDGAPRIRYHYGVYEVANDNALGTGNAMGAVFGSTAARDAEPTGTAVAYIAKPGVTITGDMSTSMDDLPLVNGYLYDVHGFQIYLGAFEPGEVWYTGDIANRDSKWTKSANGYNHCTPDQFRLTAVEGATAHFSGALSGGKAFPFEIHGAGTVELSGDNSAMVQGLSVRGGALVLADEKSSGTQSISLGATVPSVADVEFFENNFGGSAPAFTAIWTAGKNNVSFTKKDGNPIAFDSVEMQVGERVYFSADIPGGPQGVYKMTSATLLEKDADFTFAIGQRIRIAKGLTYGGTAKMVLRSSNGAVQGGVWEPAEPDVALLAANGITVTNDVVVTDNLSAGTSSLGVADASDVTFTGNITLNRAVAFYAAQGGTATFTGAISDAGETKNAVALTGTGKVVLPKMDWAGRTLDLRGIDFSALEEAKINKVTLLRAEGVGDATLITPPGKWSFAVKGDTLTASQGGFLFLVR